MLGKRSVLGLFLVVLVGIGASWVARVADEANGFPGGGMVSIVVAFVMPLLSPFLVLKEFVNRELESLIAVPIVRMLAPKAAFNESDTKPVDYADEEAWSALPWRKDTADWLPPGCGAEECDPDQQHLDDSVADLFFLSPTTFYDSCCWNTQHDEPFSSYLQDEAIIPQQAMPFNGAARIFSPRIRQMSGFGYFAEDSEKRNLAIDLAYSDVKASFEHFLANWNENRPIILAGHSQGSEHLTRLLKDYFHVGVKSSEPLRKRLVAAYVVGMPVYHDMLSEWGLKPCKHEKDTGCVISWQTFLKGSNPDHFRWETASDTLRSKNKTGGNQVCTNPLTWTSGSGAYADKTLNHGAMHIIQWAQNINFLLSREGVSKRDKQNHRIKSSLLPLKKQLIGAQCENGVLFIDHPPFSESDSNVLYNFFPVWRAASFPGGNLHPYDFNFFWMNIRKNAKLRVQTWFSSKK